MAVRSYIFVIPYAYSLFIRFLILKFAYASTNEVYQ